MRRVAGLLPLLAAGCATSPTTSDTGAVEPCEVTDCFFEREVRDFDVIDRERVVVYVGARRCPFLVEMRDVSCDISVTPAIEFFQRALGRIDRLAPVQSGRVCAATRGLVLYAGIAAPSLLQQQDAIDSAPGSRRPGGLARTGPSFPVDPTSDDVCRVSDIRSVTDDQLVELLAEANVQPPPPPVGEGQLEVPEEAEDGGLEESEEPDAQTLEDETDDTAGEETERAQ